MFESAVCWSHCVQLSQIRRERVVPSKVFVFKKELAIFSLSFTFDFRSRDRRIFRLRRARKMSRVNFATLENGARPKTKTIRWRVAPLRFGFLFFRPSLTSKSVE